MDTIEKEIEFVKLTMLISKPTNYDTQKILQAIEKGDSELGIKVLLLTGEEYALAPVEPPSKKRGRPKGSKPKKRGRPKGSKNKPKKQATNQKAMDELKKSKRAFTKAIYGWNTGKDGKLTPNWKEQNNIEWMKRQLKAGHTAASVARTLIESGIKGKNGGTPTSTMVLRTTRNKFHDTASDFQAPKWYANRSKKTIRLR